MPKKTCTQDEGLYRMRSWKQGDMFLAGQERRDCFDFISDDGFYLSPALGTRTVPNYQNVLSRKNFVRVSVKSSHIL